MSDTLTPALTELAAQLDVRVEALFEGSSTVEVFRKHDGALIGDVRGDDDFGSASMFVNLPRGRGNVHATFANVADALQAVAENARVGHWHSSYAA